MTVGLFEKLQDCFRASSTVDCCDMASAAGRSNVGRGHVLDLLELFHDAGPTTSQVHKKISYPRNIINYDFYFDSATLCGDHGVLQFLVVGTYCSGRPARPQTCPP